MKKALVTLSFVMAWFAAQAAAPAPPSNPSNPLLPAQAQIILTNTTLVYTNVAVKSPVVDFQNVTLYGGTNAFKGALVVAWDASPDTNVLAGYKLYYGPTTAAITNVYTTQKYVTVVAMWSMLNTNYPVYWFYVTAFDTNGLESLPSNVITTPSSK